MVRPGDRFEVERFLRQQGYKPIRAVGPHIIWGKPGHASVSLSHSRRVSQGVMRRIKQTVGFLPNRWK